MFQDVRYLDALGNLRAVPAILGVVVVVVLLSRKMKYTTKLQDMYAYLSDEIEILLKELDYEEQHGTEFKRLLGGGIKEKNDKNRLKLLLKIREDLAKKVNT